MHDVFPASGHSDERQAPLFGTGMFLGHSRCFEREPVEAVWPYREPVRALVDDWKGAAPEDLHRNAPRKGGEVALDVLEKPRQIGDDQEALVLIATDAGQHLLILGIEKL